MTDNRLRQLDGDEDRYLHADGRLCVERTVVGGGEAYWLHESGTGPAVSCWRRHDLAVRVDGDNVAHETHADQEAELGDRLVFGVDPAREHPVVVAFRVSELVGCPEQRARDAEGDVDDAEDDLWLHDDSEGCCDARDCDCDARDCDVDGPHTVLDDAKAAVYGDRQADYGHPRQDFTRAAVIATGLLHHKLADGEHIDADDIGRLMIGVKLARDVHSPKRDNRVDIAGYALTLDRLETGQ